MPVTETERNHLDRLAGFLNRYAEHVDYAEIRPMSTRNLTQTEMTTRLRSGGHITCDCSEAVTMMFHMALLRDPNGLGYDGYGYTGTMLDHLPHFDNWGKVHRGTLIVFGNYPGTHVVMVTTPRGDDPLVYSHGSHARSAIWPLATERTYHEGEPMTLLAIEDL